MCMPAALSLDTVNAMTRAQFVATFGGIFEDSPWIPEAAWQRRPFRGREHLLSAMRDAVLAAGQHRQLALIQAHPELGARPVLSASASATSRREQRRAGLHASRPEAANRLRQLNDAYRARFGFRFVLAVRGLDMDAVLAAISRRLAHDRDTELQAALEEIMRIAQFRLEDLLASPDGG